ncbi:hypothetical protein ACFL0K_01305 [Patescibacteria group bacterium]
MNPYFATEDRLMTLEDRAWLCDMIMKMKKMPSSAAHLSDDELRGFFSPEKPAGSTESHKCIHIPEEPVLGSYYGLET